MNQEYELVVVLNPSLGKDEHSDTRSRIAGFITGNGGEITNEEEWGNRRLAYSIRASGQTYLEGYYVLTRFKTDTSVVKEIEGNLRLLENVLRFLLVKGQPGVLRGSPLVATSEAEVKSGPAETSEAEPVAESSKVDVEAESIVTETPAETSEAEPVAESSEVDVEAESIVTETPVEVSEAEPVAESSEVDVEAESIVTEDVVQANESESDSGSIEVEEAAKSVKDME